MDQIGVLKEIYDETVQRRNAAIEQRQRAEMELNDLRVSLRLAENREREAVTRDEEVSQKMAQVRELYNGSPTKPHTLLTKLDALTGEQVEAVRERREARENVLRCNVAIERAQTKLSAARMNFDTVSNEILQLDAEIQRVRAALN